MYIELPENFEYTVSNRYTAYVKDEILYVPPRAGIWKKIAYNLTYAAKGKEICSYCGCKLTRKTVTIDHLYPKSYGGVSIPNNLFPVCPTCNTKKKDLSLKHYKELYTISDIDKRIDFLKMVYNDYEIIRYKQGFKLPKEWTSNEYIYWIYPILQYNKNRKKDSGYIKAYDFIRKYNGNVPCPLVTDSNDRIIEGNHLFWAAKDNYINIIPTIKLENVKLL